ncbi:hypothetical protein [Nocardia stercoris]|uniref:Uncharacterized protein n=1 Tax=Nocardia stercoris TaxID=2483361 RepID=A0A3M2L3J2_9NOCA|nr:hypothetical protein [Nocardia stercoris]RMI31270.1 hypothetical protein EBN03_18035 [Nocardia stercoris]
MIVILGLILVVAAVIVGVVGILNNDGSAHPLLNDFTVLGYHVTGSTAAVYVSGIVVGAVGVAGLALLLAGVRHSTRRAQAVRAERDLARRDADAARHARGDVAAVDDRPRAAVDDRAPAPAAVRPARAEHGWHLWGGRRAGHT